MNAVAGVHALKLQVKQVHLASLWTKEETVNGFSHHREQQAMEVDQVYDKPQGSETQTETKHGMTKECVSLLGQGFHKGCLQGVCNLLRASTLGTCTACPA